MSIRVEISRSDYAYAAYAGFMRNVQSLLKGRKDAHDFRGDPFGAHITGALGEYACAKAFSRFWAGPGIFRGADVGIGASELQVRSCIAPPGGAASLRLVLRDADDDDGTYVLMISTEDEPLVWTMAGWILGRDGKLLKFRTDPTGTSRTPAYFVPQSELHDGVPPLIEARADATV